MLRRLRWWRGFTTASILVVAALGVASRTSPARGAIAVGNSDFVGSRSSAAGGGIFATKQWADGGIEISWKIVDNAYDVDASGSWTYSYAVKVLPARGEELKGLSHWILEVSTSNTDLTNFLDKNGNSTFLPRGPSDGPKLFTVNDGKSNPGMPSGGVWGLKWDTLKSEEALLQVTFTSSRIPVWGDVYLKDGKSGGLDVYGYNRGFGTEPDAGATSFINWIPTPNGATRPPNPGPNPPPTHAPEPQSVAIWGLASLIGAVAFWRRRRAS